MTVKVIQNAIPPKNIEAAVELAPDISPTEPCEFSGEELAGAVSGEAPLDGSVMGEPAGVAELEGIPAEDSGVGASATGDGAGGEETFLAGLGA